MDYANNRKQKAFSPRGVTLIELLLVVAIMAIILSSAYPLGAGFLARNNFKNKINETVNSLRIAQLNSISGKEAVSWGVNVDSNQITLFSGTSYSSRNPVYDEVYDIPPSVSANPVPIEVVFDRLTGNPNSSATIVISSDSGESASVYINEVGIVDVN